MSGPKLRDRASIAGTNAECCKRKRARRKNRTHEQADEDFDRLRAKTGKLKWCANLEEYLPKEAFRRNISRPDGRHDISIVAEEIWRVIMTKLDPIVAERMSEFGVVGCGYCGATDCKFTIDHIYPGRDLLLTVANLIYACGTCNDSKGGEDVEDWLVAVGIIPTWNTKRVIAEAKRARESAKLKAEYLP
jgi:hypothetical protein